MIVFSMLEDITFTSSTIHCHPFLMFSPSSLTREQLLTSETSVPKSVHLHFYQIICLSCCCYIYKYSISIPLHIAFTFVVITFHWIKLLVGIKQVRKSNVCCINLWEAHSVALVSFLFIKKFLQSNFVQLKGLAQAECSNQSISTCQSKLELGLKQYILLFQVLLPFNSKLAYSILIFKELWTLFHMINQCTHRLYAIGFPLQRLANHRPSAPFADSSNTYLDWIIKRSCTYLLK